MEENIGQQPPVTLQEPQAPQPTPEVQPVITQEVNKGPSFKKPLVIVVLLGLLVGFGFVGFSIIRNQRGEKVQTKPTTNISPSPVKQKEGPYTSYQTITLSDSQGGILTGTATRSIIPEHVFVSVSANLSDPPEGQFYQVWLGNNQGDLVLVGYLFKGADGQFTTANDLPAPTFSSFNKVLYNNLLVTSEATDDSITETKLLEGTFIQ